MDGKPSLKGAWLGHVNHFNSGGHQTYLWNGWSTNFVRT